MSRLRARLRTLFWGNGGEHNRLDGFNSFLTVLMLFLLERLSFQTIQAFAKSFYIATKNRPKQ